MKKNDYRHRLKNHDTEVNENAWTQMSTLLDSSPIGPKEEKKKRRFLFFILPFFVGVISIFLLIKHVDQPNNSISSSNQVKHNEINSNQVKTLESKNDEDIVLNETSSKEVNIQNRLQDGEINNSEDQKNKDISSRSTSLTKQYTATTANENKSNSIGLQKKDNTTITSNFKQETASLNAPDTKEQITIQLELHRNEQNIFTPNTKTTQIKPGSINTSSDNFNNQAIFNVEAEIEKIITNAGTSKSSKSTYDGLGKSNSQLLIKPISRITISHNSLLTKESTLISNPPELVIQKPNRVYYTGELGGSDLNGLKGIYIGAGVFWDFDKVIGLESSLSLFTSKNNSNSFDPILNEREINLILWVHLNLVRNDNHKISLEFGPGIETSWTKFSDTNISRHDGFYYNLFGGASYTYFINKQCAIGFKIAGSRFDSSFATFKLLKKF